MKPEKITESEYEVYKDFDHQNNKKGYLGETATDKAFDDLGVLYSSNPKDDTRVYKRTQGKGSDHRLTEIGTEIEVKNIRSYPFTFSMFKKLVLSRYSPHPDDYWIEGEVPEEIPRIKPNFHKLLIVANLNANDLDIRYVGESGIFIIVLGFQIDLENFDEAVRVLRGKILRFFRIHHRDLYHGIIYSSCDRFRDSDEEVDKESIYTLFRNSLKSLSSRLSDHLLEEGTSSDRAYNIKYTEYGSDPPPEEEEIILPSPDRKKSWIFGLSERILQAKDGLLEKFDSILNREDKTEDRDYRLVWMLDRGERVHPLEAYNNNNNPESSSNNDNFIEYWKGQRGSIRQNLGIKGFILDRRNRD